MVAGQELYEIPEEVLEVREVRVSCMKPLVSFAENEGGGYHCPYGGVNP